MINFKVINTIVIGMAILAGSCKKQVFIPDETAGRASHNNGYPADYDQVFKQNEVQKFEFIFTSDEWEDMQDDLSSKVSTGGPPGQFDNEDPSYFHCTVKYNDLTWENVGIRYKGNSSLRANSGKLPLRLQFDEFEDEFPEIMNQRFYGFKELSLSSNYNDPSLMREKSADDLFREFGVPAVRSAFYEIYIDRGTGTSEYFGLYTVLEIVDDNFLNDWFGSKTGNCYKPDGDGAKFANTGFDLSHFEQKTNVGVARTDIQEMFDALHATDRTSNPSQWRANLEKVFDVDGFLKYLAANNTLQNWDTYGRMTHNYYLYHDPSDGLIKWIIWDNNESFQEGKRGGSVSFGMTEIGTDWPLMNYLINDDTYEAQYKAYIKSFIEGPFAASRMNDIFSTQQSLLTTSATNERSGYSYVNGAVNFNSAVNTLKSHNSSRIAAANAYIQ